MRVDVGQLLVAVRRLAAEPEMQQPMSAAAHLKAARQTRVRYDGIRNRAFRRMEGWDHPPESQ